MAPAKKSGFVYKPRTQEQLQKRANQSGSPREGFIKDKFKTWSPSTGKNRVRFFPPTYEDAEHYGLDVYVHYSIGPDNSAFICLGHLEELGYENEECPICKMRTKAERDGDEELAAALKPNKRVLAWIIDRNKPQEGPLLWGMPWTLDRNITNACSDEDNNTTYNIDDPVKGNDVTFMRTGKEQYTKYENERVVTKSIPLSDDEQEQDEWMQYVLDHPLTDCVVIPEVDKIEEALAGGVSRRRSGGSKDKDDDDRGRGRRSRDEDDDSDSRGRSRRGRDEDEEDKPRSRRRDEDDGDDDTGRGSRGRSSRSRDEDEDEPPPRSSRRRNSDPDDEEPPKRRPRLDEPDEEPRRGRSSRNDDSEDDGPPPRRRIREESDSSPSRSRRNARDDDDADEQPARSRSRVRDQDEDTENGDEDDGNSRSSRSRQSSSRSSSSRAKDDDDSPDEEEDEGRSSRRQAVREKINTVRRR